MPAIPWMKILSEATRRFGVERLRPGQRDLIEAVLHGRDALGVLPTGAGKSLCFQLPALFLPAPVLVVSPLIALMKDQQDHLADASIEATTLNSTLTMTEERAEVSQIRRGERDLIYVSPERLDNVEQLEMLARKKFSLFVVDEAHCVSSWGHSFRPAYLGLRHAAQALGRPPILALTATATPEVMRDVVATLGMRDPLVVDLGIRRPNLVFEVERTVNEDAKRAALWRLLREAGGGSLIVYFATVSSCEAIFEFLRNGGISVGRYHGKLRRAEREASQAAFMSGDTQVMLATKAFGMGIDKPDIRRVIHYHFPDSPESYYQEAGRAGRDGERAVCTLLYRLEDRRIQSYFLGGTHPSPPEVQRVWAALNQLDTGDGTSVAAVTAAADVGPRRLRAILGELEHAELLRRDRRLHVDIAAGPSGLDDFLATRDERVDRDRDRLAAMMRYAQTGECRLRYLEEYFGVEAHDCGRCDNCAHPLRATA